MTKKTPPPKKGSGTSVDPPPASPADGFESPFAKLAALRAALPPGETPNQEPSSREAHERLAKERLFGDKVVVRHTRKGHGGKTVTVVSGVVPAALDALCAEMKKALGCGARVEDQAVVLQGDLVDRAVAFVEKKGAKKVVRGS